MCDESTPGVPGPDGSVAASDDAQRLDWLERERAEARKNGFQWNTWAYDALQSDLTIRQQIDKARGAHGVNPCDGGGNG